MHPNITFIMKIIRGNYLKKLMPANQKVLGNNKGTHTKEMTKLQYEEKPYMYIYNQGWKIHPHKIQGMSKQM